MASAKKSMMCHADTNEPPVAATTEGSSHF